MKKQNRAYWTLRSRQRMAEYHRDADKTIKTVTAAYDKAQSDLSLEIDKIFKTYANNGKMDPKIAAKMLNEPVSPREWAALKRRLPGIQDPDIRRDVLSRLNAPAYKARITRLQMLREQIYLGSKEIADVEIRTSRRAYIKVIDDAYYRHMFDIQRGLGIGFDFAQMPNSTVQEILTNPWSGQQFSSRVWANTDVLANNLTNIMTAGFMSGAGNRQMVKELMEAMSSGKFAATRLIRTEYTYMANAAEMQSYKAAEIDQYIYVATLDSRTSLQCRKADRQVFFVKDAMPGKNMPPLHAFCRSTTRAYFGPDTLAGIQRRARDPVTGETQLVPASINYQQWHEKYVVGKHGADRINTIEKQLQNRASDKNQHKDFKKLLGKDAPQSFSEFQEMKYNKRNDWSVLKRQASTFQGINNTTFSDEYKRKLKGTYRYFKDDGYEFTTHALNRVLGPKQSKGKVIYSKEDIKAMLYKPHNYLQPDGKLIRFENGVSVIQASDTGEIVSVVARNKPKEDWKGV